MLFFHEKKREKFAALILIVFFSLAFSGKLQAGQKSNIHIGAVELHPFASLKQSYDSNVFLEPKGEEDHDYITEITLGAESQMPLIPQRQEDFMFKASYSADIIEYWNEKQTDRVDHNVAGDLDFLFTNDLRLTIKDRFVRTADQPDSERTALDKRFRNNLGTALTYDREKIRLIGSYAFVRDDYIDTENLDKADHMFSGAVFYQIFSKTSILTEFNYGTISYDVDLTNSDSRYYQARGGVTGEILPKLTGIIKAGYRHSAYEEKNKKDFSGLALYGTLKYTTMERTEINFDALRTSQESSYSTNSHYISNRAELRLAHQLSERLSVRGEGFYELNKYPDETTEASETARRKDALWGAGAGAGYEIKEWLLLSADYEFKRRDSNFSIFDYKDNKVSLQVLVTF